MASGTMYRRSLVQAAGVSCYSRGGPFPPSMVALRAPPDINASSPRILLLPGCTTILGSADNHFGFCLVRSVDYDPGRYSHPIGH